MAGGLGQRMRGRRAGHPEEREDEDELGAGQRKAGERQQAEQHEQRAQRIGDAG